MTAVLYCLGISTLYVASLYIWRVPASRQHPDTVKARMFGVLMTCCVAWLPAWHMHRQLRQHFMASSLHPAGVTGTASALAGLGADSLKPDSLAAAAVSQQPQLLQLLGLDVSGQELLAAHAKSIALTMVLFLGPLYHRAQCVWQQHKQKGAVAWWEADRQPVLHQVRDYVVSPLAEEWSFRSCMVPLLWMQGYKWPILIFATPLFFGMCHLHHGWGMVQLYGLSVRVAAMCLLQFLYTTVFGWFATWIMLATGSTVAAVLVHSLCNVLGLPPFHRMGRCSLVLCFAGLVLFGLIAPRVLLPTARSAFWWGPVLQVLR